jgi:hypothetical protein
MNRIFLVLLLVLASWSVLAADVCGSPGEKPSVKSVVVHLQGKPTGPAFYYRTDLYHVVFVSQASMTAFLNKLTIPDSATTAKALVKSIRADMPLREDRDLFRYNFSDWFNMNLTESMLVDLLEHGKVALVAPGGDLVEKITIVHERTPDITLTRIYAGKKGENEIFTLRGCIAD